MEIESETHLYPYLPALKISRGQAHAHSIYPKHPCLYFKEKRKNTLSDYIGGVPRKGTTLDKSRLRQISGQGLSTDWVIQKIAEKMSV